MFLDGDSGYIKGLSGPEQNRSFSCHLDGIFYRDHVNQSNEDLIYYNVHMSLLLNPGKGCYENG